MNATEKPVPAFEQIAQQFGCTPQQVRGHVVSNLAVLREYRAKALANPSSTYRGHSAATLARWIARDEARVAAFDAQQREVA